MPVIFQRPGAWRESLRASLLGLATSLLVARLWPRDAAPGRSVAAFGAYLLVTGIAYQIITRSTRPLAQRVEFAVLISIVGTVLYGLIVGRM